MSEGEWPGRWCTSQRAAGEPSSLAVGQRVRDRASQPPQPRNARDTARSAVDDVVAGSRGAASAPRRSASSRSACSPKSSTTGASTSSAHTSAPERSREDLDQPDVVDVLVGDDDPLEVLDPAAVLGQRALQRVERRARVRPAVDQRQRVVLDQVAVDAPDRERRRDRQAVDRVTSG